MKTGFVSLLFLTLFTISSNAQSNWSEWKSYPDQEGLQYRMAFHQNDIETNRSGYFVEVRNETLDKVWFQFKLYPSDEKDKRGQTTLKPNSKSVIGIYWVDAEVKPEGIFLNVRFEKQDPVAITANDPMASGK